MPLIHKLEETKGTLLVVSSGAAKLMSPRCAPYAATKAAVHTFIDSIRQDLILHSSNVTLITSTLGNIDTPNAIKATKSEIDHLGWYSARSTARSILLAVLAKQQHHNFPFVKMWFPIAIRQLMPISVDSVIRNVVAKGFS
uniref:Uncharacterized protein n=1 Tax=Lotharella oceanica TaxID=641309 RepID=A0A7S2XIN8_9EUKA|mmetsp:Transcript_4385/g.8785  ORF Transcript_4385/g.8785 Transcript_4385/m.8785 type:complete len:141 (+) Transcript_4385:219-641(+)